MKYYTIGGITKNISEWSRAANINPMVAGRRLRDSWKPVEAFFKPTYKTYDVYLRRTEELVLTGMPLKEIAQRLNIAVNTAVCYSSNHKKGKYIIYPADQETGQEIFDSLMEEGKIK